MTNDSKIFLILGALALATLGGVTVAKRTLSHRNNNPGNIEKGTAWKGIDAQATAVSPRFIVFAHPKWGFRAMARILLGDFREGQNTVRSLITEWSPPTDVFRGTAKPQNTAAYIKAVATALRISADQPFDVAKRLPELLAAIARHETGYWPAEWTPAVIAEGIALERTA